MRAALLRKQQKIEGLQRLLLAPVICTLYLACFSLVACIIHPRMTLSSSTLARKRLFLTGKLALESCQSQEMKSIAELSSTRQGYLYLKAPFTISLG